MAIVVRNTFIHLEDPERGNVANHVGRSSSAPPACRPTVSHDIVETAKCRPSVSHDIVETPKSLVVSTDTSAVDSDEESPGIADTSTDSERAEETDNDESSLGGFDSAGDEPVAPPVVPAAVQHEVDAMSKAVMEMWSRLGAIEAEFTHEHPDAQTPLHCNKQPAAPALLLPAAPRGTEAGQGGFQRQAMQRPAAATKCGDNDESKPCKSSRKHARIRRLNPSDASLQEAHNVLDIARHALDSIPSVVSTELVLAAVGAIVRLAIKMVPNSPDSSYERVAAILKAALLEAAACSGSVYVLGYEASPFQDDVCGMGFTATLAIAPSSCERTTCWETYQKGVCPRGAACKWQHPGRNCIQPIRVAWS